MKKTNMLLVVSIICLLGTGFMSTKNETTQKVKAVQKRKEANQDTPIKQRFKAQTNIESKDTITSISMKPGFYSINQSIYFFDELGIPHTGFITFEGHTYYLFDKKGLAHGWTTIGNDTYYFNDQGFMASGLTTIDKKEYYFNDQGKLTLGFVLVGDKTFYFSENGKQTGFLKLNDAMYYVDKEKGLLTSFQTIYDHEYYFEKDGIMVTGFKEINNNTYYFNNHGWRETGWIEAQDKKYYLKETTLLKGIQTIEEDTYYFNNDGNSEIGLQQINDQLYYFDEDGKMIHGFKTIDDKTYYFDPQGQSQTGFILEKNHTYYLDSDQTLKTGLVTIDQNTYYFNDQGVMQIGWQTINNEKKYFNSDGKMNTKELVTEQKKYQFNQEGSIVKEEQVGKTFYKEDGSVLATNAKKVIDVSKFQGIINWEQVKESDIDGVILRLGFGSYSVDAMFERNLQELKRLGIPYGIYLYSYAVNKEESESEANFVLSMLEKYQINPTLGIYYDIERNDITNHLGILDYEMIIPTFLQRVRTSNYKTNVYTYKSLANEKLYSENLTKEITWIAQYNSICTWTGFYEGWQYTSTGQVHGIKGNVDISIFGNFKR